MLQYCPTTRSVARTEAAVAAAKAQKSEGAPAASQEGPLTTQETSDRMKQEVQHCWVFFYLGDVLFPGYRFFVDHGWNQTVISINTCICTTSTKYCMLAMMNGNGMFPYFNRVTNEAFEAHNTPDTGALRQPK